MLKISRPSNLQGKLNSLMVNREVRRTHMQVEVDTQIITVMSVVSLINKPKRRAITIIDPPRRTMATTMSHMSMF